MFLKENVFERKCSEEIFFKRKCSEEHFSKENVQSLCPLLPSAKDELIGVSPALLLQQIKPQTTFWMDVEICQELSSWQII